MMSKLTLLIVLLLYVSKTFADIDDSITQPIHSNSHRQYHHQHHDSLSNPAENSLKFSPTKRSIQTKPPKLQQEPTVESSPVVNQIPLNDAISSNFAEIQGELPTDRQVSIVLPFAQLKRFYFQTAEPQTSFSLTITPCETSLRYELMFINANSIKKLRKRKVRRRSKKYYVKLLKRRLQQHATKLLVNQTVSDRFSYTEENILEHGLYILQMSAQEFQNTSVQIYLSSSSSRSPFPRLPPVASVLSKQIKTKNDSAVEIWWNPVIAVKYEPASIYEYCIAINQYLKPRSLCLSHDQMLLNQSSNMITKFHETEFWLKESENEVRHFLDSNPTSAKDEYFSCGRENIRQIHGLRSDNLYRVNVFVRNLATGFVSRYWESNFTLMKPKIEPTSVPIKSLHESLFTGIFLDYTNRFTGKFQYASPKNEFSDRLFVFVQPCQGIGPVKIIVNKSSGNSSDSNNDKYNMISDDPLSDYIYDDFEDEPEGGELLNEEISETKTFEIKIPGDRYSVEIELNTEDIKQSRSLVLLVSSDLSRFPFPRMPSNRAIRSLYSMRKCNSVTLAWNASPDPTIRYCIFQRDADYRYSNFEESKELCNHISLPRSNPVKRALNSNDQNSAEIDDEEEEKRFTPTRQVSCRRYKSSRHRQDNMIIQNIRHLQPGKRYVFQVVAQKNRGQELTYEQVWTETKPESQCRI